MRVISSQAPTCLRCSSLRNCDESLHVASFQPSSSCIACILSGAARRESEKLHSLGRGMERRPPPLLCCSNEHRQRCGCTGERWVIRACLAVQVAPVPCTAAVRHRSAGVASVLAPSQGDLVVWACDGTCRVSNGAAHSEIAIQQKKCTRCMFGGDLQLSTDFCRHAPERSAASEPCLTWLRRLEVMNE